MCLNEMGHFYSGERLVPWTNKCWSIGPLRKHFGDIWFDLKLFFIKKSQFVKCVAMTNHIVQWTLFLVEAGNTECPQCFQSQPGTVPLHSRCQRAAATVSQSYRSHDTAPAAPSRPSPTPLSATIFSSPSQLAPVKPSVAVDGPAPQGAKHRRRRTVRLYY